MGARRARGKPEWLIQSQNSSGWVAAHSTTRAAVTTPSLSLRSAIPPNSTSSARATAATRRLQWQLASGRSNQLFRQSWGYWQIEPHRDGALLTYAMAAQTVLPAFLTRGAEREGLVDTIKAVRDRAEHGL